MAENSVKDSVNSLLSGLDGFVSSKTVVGTPVKVNDTVILPLIDIQLGVGAGAYGRKANSTGGGMGAKMTPSAVLVIQGDGTAKMISVKGQDTVTKVLDMVPDVVDRLKKATRKKEADPEVDAKVDEILHPEEN